jgi:mono/diheme cytochrome c family protein
MNQILRWTGIILLVTLTAACLVAGTQPAQDESAPAVKPEIKKVPAPNVNPASGKDMYMAYCAACHGADGRGDGPAAPALKTPPTNLTLLAAKKAGRFPEAQVQQSIKGDPNMLSAHGSKDMPVWGPTFLQLGSRSAAQAQLRIRNLTSYIESIQSK